MLFCFVLVYKGTDTSSRIYHWHNKNNVMIKCSMEIRQIRFIVVDVSND